MAWNPDVIKPCAICKRDLTPPEQIAAVKNEPTPHGLLFIVPVCPECYQAEYDAIIKERG